MRKFEFLDENRYPGYRTKALTPGYTIKPRKKRKKGEGKVKEKLIRKTLKKKDDLAKMGVADLVTHGIMKGIRHLTKKVLS